MRRIETNVMRELQKGGLGRHLILIVVVKLVVLAAIWFAFFRSSVAPDTQQVGDAILRRSVPASPSSKE